MWTETSRAEGWPGREQLSPLQDLEHWKEQFMVPRRLIGLMLGEKNWVMGLVKSKARQTASTRKASLGGDCSRREPKCLVCRGWLGTAPPNTWLPEEVPARWAWTWDLKKKWTGINDKGLEIEFSHGTRIWFTTPTSGSPSRVPGHWSSEELPARWAHWCAGRGHGSPALPLTLVLGVLCHKAVCEINNSKGRSKKEQEYEFLYENLPIFSY